MYTVMAFLIPKYKTGTNRNPKCGILAPVIHKKTHLHALKTNKSLYLELLTFLHISQRKWNELLLTPKYTWGKQHGEPLLQDKNQRK